MCIRDRRQSKRRNFVSRSRRRSVRRQNHIRIRNRPGNLWPAFLQQVPSGRSVKMVVPDSIGLKRIGRRRRQRRIRTNRLQRRARGSHRRRYAHRNRRVRYRMPRRSKHNFILARPVSYTHLDVYKRQPPARTPLRQHSVAPISP